MNFNSHRRNRSLFTQKRDLVQVAHHSLRKLQHPATQNWSFIMAKQYYQHQNMQVAIPAFEDYLSTHPQHLEALYLCALAYLQVQKPEKAIPKLEEYLSLRKTNIKTRKLIINKQLGSVSNAWLLLSMAYNKVNQGPAAMNAVNESLRHDAKFQDAYCCRGKLYLKEGEYQKAENDYKATIKLNNRSWMALSGMADCYRMKSQYQSAIKYYDRSLASLADATVELYQNEQRLIKEELNIPEIELKRCICLYYIEQYGQCEIRLEQLLHQLKTSQTYYYLAASQLKLGQQDKNPSLTQKAILNFEYSIQCNSNKKISNKAIQTLIKTYILNYQYYEAVNVVQLGKRKKLAFAQHAQLVTGCMEVIKQNYSVGKQQLKALYYQVNPSNQRPHPSASKKERVNLLPQSMKTDENMWMIPIILLFWAYAEFFCDHFMDCLEVYELYENHIRDYLGEEMEQDVNLMYNKVLCEGILMIENSMIEESLDKFMICIDNYFVIEKGVPVEPVLFRILGLIKIYVSECPEIATEVQPSSKILQSIIELIQHYLPAVKKAPLIYYYKGLVLLVLKQPALASEELEKCLKLTEECSWKYLYVKGIAQLERGSVKEAVKEFSAGLLLKETSDIYLGRCISYILLYNETGNTSKQTVFIEKSFDDLQKFIELETDKEKISKWVSKVLFYNEAYEEVNKSIEKVQDRCEDVIYIQECVRVFEGVFEEGGILGSILMNAFEGQYQKDRVIVAGEEHFIVEEEYFNESYRKWLQILSMFVGQQYQKLVKFLQLCIFDEKNDDQILELRYNLAITFMLVGEFNKADNLLGTLPKYNDAIQSRVEKLRGRNFQPDQCIPDLEEELKNRRRLTSYLSYTPLHIENKTIFVKPSIPFPSFRKPNIILQIDPSFLLEQTKQSCIPKKIQAPWINKNIGNVQFTDNLVESDLSFLLQAESQRVSVDDY